MKNRRVILFTKTFALCGIALAALSMNATAQVPFQKAFGTEGFEKGSAIRQLSDGGFIIGGETQSYGLTETDMLLIRTDATGNVQWTKTYGGPEREVVNDVVQMPDRGFLFVAEKYQPNKKEGEFLTLAKTDASGNLAWKKIYDEGGNETEGFSMAATPDENYVITGIVKKMSVVSSAFFTMSGEDQNLYLIKVDKSGNKVWSRCLNSSSGDVASTGTSVIVAKDGSYIATGNITKKGKTDKKLEKPVESVSEDESRNMLLIKVKPDGSLAWANEYSANRITAGFSVIEKQEGGFLVAGIATPDATNNVDYFIMSLAADGSLLWAKTFGGPKFDPVSDVWQTADGGFMVSGTTHSYGAGSSDILIFKTDNSGNLLWAKTYGGESGEYGARMVLTADGIAMTGQVSMGKESFDVMLLKTDLNGNSVCWGKNAALDSKKFPVISRRIEGASMIGVEQGITPPNFKRADVNNISQQSREARTKNICP